MNTPGAAGTAGGLSPGSGGGGGGSWNWRRSGGGRSSADVSRLLAGPAPHAPPEQAREGEGERGRRSRGFRVAPQEGTQALGALRMRRSSRDSCPQELAALGPLPKVIRRGYLALPAVAFPTFGMRLSQRASGKTGLRKNLYKEVTFTSSLAFALAGATLEMLK